jgi:DNA-binding NarL/FixJ family response regulator
LSDDHPLIRSALRELLNNEPDCVVVAEADNGNYVLALLDEHKPDVLIIDLTMPGIPVPEIIRETKRSTAHVKVIVLSMHIEGDYVRRAMSAGADAYLTKDAPAAELLKAIGEVVSGRTYLSASVKKVLEDVTHQQESANDPLKAITSREKQVLALAAEGNSSIEIAQKLRISRRTAETHRANLMRKLELHSQTDLVHLAFRCGLLTVEKVGL